MKAIFQRRSTRAFKKCEVSEENLKYLLSAAMSAPNSGNQKSWEFIVLRSEEIRAKMNKFYGYGDLVNDVDVAIVTCINKERMKFDDRWQIDTGAAVSNMITAATDKGFATLWAEIYPVEEKMVKAREILGLSENVIPMMILMIGESTKELDEREPRYYEEYVKVM